MDDTQYQQNQMKQPMMPEQQAQMNDPNQQQQQIQYQNQPPMYQQTPFYQNQPQPPYYQNQPPQGQAYQQGQPQAPLIVIQQQPGYIPDSNLFAVATNPVSFYCPKCQKQQVSKVYPEVGAGTHIVAIGLCFVTVLCCWIPYVVDSCQDTVHSCPECKIEVGRRRFINI